MNENSQIIDLSKLIKYFEKLSETVDSLYPKQITWDNVNDYNFDLDLKHPEWIKIHFPLILIYHRQKAGQLRKSKNIEIMYQNNFNVLTQLVWTADDFGMFYRKNKHKGFSNIVAAIQATQKDRESFYVDLEKPKKYKDFIEFLNLYNPTDIRLKALCEILNKNYSCDSTGQIRLL